MFIRSDILVGSTREGPGYELPVLHGLPRLHDAHDHCVQPGGQRNLWGEGGGLVRTSTRPPPLSGGPPQGVESRGGLEEGRWGVKGGGEKGTLHKFGGGIGFGGAL